MIAQFSSCFSLQCRLKLAGNFSIPTTNETAESVGRKMKNSTPASNEHKFDDFSVSFLWVYSFHFDCLRIASAHRSRITTQAEFVDIEIWLSMLLSLCKDERMFLSIENYARSRWHRFTALQQRFMNSQRVWTRFCSSKSVYSQEKSLRQHRMHCHCLTQKTE